MMKIRKDISNRDFVKLLNIYLVKDKNNQAYERSLYYILNAVRRGGYVIEVYKEIFVFARSYDKPNSVSLIFSSKPDMIKSDVLELFFWEFSEKEFFIHHLFETRASEIINSVKNSKIVNKKISEDVGSYADEDTFPQVILPVRCLPRFDNSFFLKNKYLYETLWKTWKNSFKKDILEYLNISKRNYSEPEEFTILIEKSSRSKLKEMMAEIVQNVSKTRSKRQSKKNPDFDEYHLQPILNLIKNLLDKKKLQDSNSKIIFRAFYDTQIEKWGFWIWEYIIDKCLLIPFVILTDYYYREQYKFLLFDIISYAYFKNIDFVNYGGSEDGIQFNLKSSVKMFFDNRIINRYLYTVYINTNGHNTSMGV